jgi:PPM family protein phosphatase
VVSLRWGSATDPGRIRPDNEDNLLTAPRVFAVADGMGGHRAGEVASALAIDLLRSRLSEPGADLDDVVSAIAEANGDIYRAALDNPAQQGMGTTITALIVISDGAADGPSDDAGEGDAPSSETKAQRTSSETDRAELFALINVGDSRTYLLRHGRLRRVTVDHSYVQELVTTGHITDDEARTHPRRNIVTRALGIDPSVRVDAWTLPIVRGDRFLLCSDGLVDEVRDDAISDVLTTISDAQNAAEELVALANREGGRDNVTVVVVDVLDGAEPPDPETELDLEPAWEPGATSGTWTVDDPETQATEFEDLAELVAEPPASVGAAGALDTTPAAPARPVTDQMPVVAAEGAPPRRRRRLGGFLGGLGVLAVLMLAFVITAAYARRVYYVDFNTNGDVVIYQGRPDGFLWFEPTVKNPTVLSRGQLDDDSIARVERRPEFSSLSNAQQFVAEQLQTTTTTSPPTTTTSPPTTTTAPTTTTRPRRTTITGP